MPKRAASPNRARASAPGEPPRSRSGRLARGLQIESNGTAGRVVVGPTTGVDYAAALEFGTRHMAARPFLLPAALRVRPQLAKLFADSMRAVLEAFTRK